MGIILIIVFHYIHKNDTDKNITNETKLLNNFDNFDDNQDKYQDKYQDNTLNKQFLNIYENTKDKIFKDKNNLGNIYSGYIDSDGKYRLGPNYSDIDSTLQLQPQTQSYNGKKSNKKVSWDKSVSNETSSRKPTVENPFANIVFADYLDKQNIAPAYNSDIDDKDIQKDMQNLYNSSIYRNIDDVWERENSQRMFYTVPIQNLPNSQTDFANWLYKTGPTCHENTQNCTYYEDPSMVSARY